MVRLWAALILLSASAGAAEDLPLPAATTLDLPELAEGLAAVVDDPASEDPAAGDFPEGMPDLPGDGAGSLAPDSPDLTREDASTLADMQADLLRVAADLQALRAELLASGAEGFARAGGGSAIERMDALETRLNAITSRTERLAERLRRVVADGTNRIGDIEFRLCEMDPHCDLGALVTADLGTAGPAMSGPSGLAPMRPGAGFPGDPIDLTVGGDHGAAEPLSPEITTTTLPPVADVTDTPPTEEEAREFAEAAAAIASEDWRGAIPQLDHLIEAHAGGPMTARSLFLRGIAYHELGEPELAAKSWLNAFSAQPDGPQSAPSLIALSRAMDALGTPEDGCPYLAEVRRRFPGSAEAAEAERALATLSCPDPAPDGG